MYRVYNQRNGKPILMQKKFYMLNISDIVVLSLTPLKNKVS